MHDGTEQPMNRSTELQTSSTDTGPTRIGTTLPAIGPGHGNGGSETSLTPADLAQAQGRLMARMDNPAECTNDLVEGLRQSCGLELGPRSGKSKTYLMRVEDWADFDKALRICSAAMVSAPIDDLTKALATIDAVCVQARPDGVQAEVRASVFLDRLTGYPADIALYVLDKWSRTQKFFPSWAELQLDLDYFTDRRRMIVDSIAFVENSYLAAKAEEARA